MGLSLYFNAGIVWRVCVKNIRSSFGGIAECPLADNSYKLRTKYNYSKALEEQPKAGRNWKGVNS